MHLKFVKHMQLTEPERRKAVQKVEKVAALTAQRIDAKEWAVINPSSVCRRTGPHKWCFFHMTDQVKLKPIPNSVAAHGKHLGHHKEQIYLGHDGHLYRYGKYRAYRVKLMDRLRVRGIRRLIPKLEAM